MEFKKPGEKYLQKKPQATPASDTSGATEDKPKRSTKTKKSKPASKNPFQGKYRLPLFIAIGVVAVAAIACGIFLLISVFSSNEGKLTSDLERLGGDFYENYYYEQLSKAYEEDRLKDFLSKYESTGIKVNLDNLDRYPSEELDNKAMVAEFINSKTDEACDTAATKVSIFPSEPYGRSDYRLEASLSCGFEE